MIATEPASDAAPSSNSPQSQPRQSQPQQSSAAQVRSLAIDVAVPLGVYLLMRHAIHASLVTSLTVSSVVPAIRTISAAVSERKLNALSAMMLAVNVVGIGLTFLTGDARLMIAKDSTVSGVFALAILLSVLRGHPLMTAGLTPYLTRGDPEKMAALNQLATTSGRFRRYELRFSLIWGVCLLVDCVARLVGALTLPVSTMSWLGSIFSVAGVCSAMVIGGAAAAAPLEQLLRTELARQGAR